ncbi:MAG: T9SS type B sorting domain-containing protein, partial [Bacteroidetes bacterium]|nr:T9SS type B sorting domain-containing protein [Bacteroidota bacterium]
SINGSVILILESTNNGGCLAVYDTVEVFLSSPATVFAGNDTTICANNGFIQLNGQVFGGTGAGVWSSSGNGIFTPSANDLNASYQIDSLDIVNGSVVLILDAVNSCVPASDTIIITIDPAPIADAGNNITICEGETASLNGSVTFAGGGEWITSGTGIFVPDNVTLNAQYVPSAGDIANGTVTLVLASTNNGLCDAVTDTIILTISPLPITDFTPQGGQFNINQVIDFMNQSQNATTYFWDFGINGDTSVLENPSYSYGANGLFTVTLIATNAAGCVDTITYDFEIIGDDVKPVVVPTAFTPNGDGINDVFSILGGPFKSYQLTVYNEWGQEIFMSDDQADGWNGSFKGSSQPSGSYVYVFTGVTIADETITLQGEIAIIR